MTMKTPAVRCVTLAFALAAPGLQAATDVAFGHFAAGAPAVRLEWDGGALDPGFEYREYRAHQPFAAGAHTITARGQNGAVVATRTIELADRDAVGLFLAGDGTTLSPYEWRRSIDHNHPIPNNGVTVQIANLAPRVDPATGQLASIGVDIDCGQIAPSILPFGAGTDGSENLHLSTRNCEFVLVNPATGASLAHTSFPTAPGSRVRLIAAGNGVTTPVEALAILQRVEPTVGYVAVSEAVEGLWFEPTDDGAGLSIAFRRSTSGAPAIAGVYYGYDSAGNARWNLLATGDPTGRHFTLYEYVGASGTGEGQAVRIVRGNGLIDFHSCREATLILESSDSSAVGLRTFPRDAIRLQKLLPVGSCG